MMTRKNISRRLFLRSLGCSSAVGLVRPLHVLSGLVRWWDLELTVSRLARVFDHVESAAVVGQAYLEHKPGEANPRFLVDRICSGLGGRCRDGVELSKEKLRSILRESAQRDFEECRTVKVRGWILSETEARLCALVALS